MSSNQACHLVFMNVKGAGHVNPTLSIVAELKVRGCQITYFADEELRSYVEAAGASWRPFRPGHHLRELDEAGIAKYVPEGTPKERYNSLPQSQARAAELLLPALLEDLSSLEPKPTAIIYDPFVSSARVAAHVLQVPAIATLTMPGPAVLEKPKAVQEAWEAEPWVDGPRRAIIAQYGFDIFEEGMPLEFYSPVLNIVTTIDELFMPPAMGHQQERFGSFPFQMVGLLAQASLKRVANASVAEEGTVAETVRAESIVAAVEQSLQAGKQAIYVSLGTIATSDNFYRKPFGHFGRQNGLADITGREVAQHVFRCCFEAFGNKDDLLVVLSLGPQEDILDGLPPLPGANSMHEALGHGVPMIVVPMFGDQPLNGDSIAKCGAGINFRSPMQSLTTESLRGALDQLLEPCVGPSECNPFQEAAKTMAKKIADAGGPQKAADIILQSVQTWMGRQALPALLGSRKIQSKESHCKTAATDADLFSQASLA